MYNLAKAAEAGFAGPVAEALDYELTLIRSANGHSRSPVSADPLLSAR
jgi:hypothetical protein